jgi:hypothetical protein
MRTADVRGTVGARIAIVLAAALGMTVPSGSAAAALPTTNVPIQPGAPMIPSWTYFESFCTMNFVFKDRAKEDPNTYIGTARYCTEGLGSRATAPQVGAFGTVVFEGDKAADFALIKIDRNKLQYVSRVVRGFGTAPTGYTTSQTTNAGDPLVTHGYAYGAAHDALGITRLGVLGDDTSTHYWSSIQPNIQDRGSPVIRADGKAVGMSDEISSFWATWLPEAPPISRYPTVEGLLRQLTSAGFNVTL